MPEPVKNPDCIYETCPTGEHTPYVEPKSEAQLGLATTRQLLDELICRMEITAEGDFEEVLNAQIFGSFCKGALNRLTPQILNYRTVDGD